MNLPQSLQDDQYEDDRTHVSARDRAKRLTEGARPFDDDRVPPGHNEKGQHEH
ncbi:hypothetical protein Skr01_25480 [Sphaerisporangium krabiense]|nr:hypothetical protein Skr01_25480 [Sphaerisporangium krabiense]